MRILRRTSRAILSVFSLLILLCLLIGGGIGLWQGVATQDQGLVIVSLIMVLCALLGIVALLQILMPRLNIFTPDKLSVLFWVMLGIPVCGICILVSIMLFYKEILLQGNWRNAGMIIYGIGFPLSIFIAWLRSRKERRAMHEVWEEWFASLRKRR